MERQFIMYMTMNNAIRQHEQVFRNIEKDDLVSHKITEASLIVETAIIGGKAVFLCGNGGSAADAQHIATEFVSRFYKERRAINAEALTTNTSSLTAIANDYDFDRIFERQLEAKGKLGDVLIGFTTSGTSGNVIRAMEYAAKHGIHTILLTGNKPNEYDSSIYECVIKVPSDDTPRIQEAHIFIGHVIAEYVEAKIVEDEMTRG